jgi:DHA2 family multidrug resistance protein
MSQITSTQNFPPITNTTHAAPADDAVPARTWIAISAAILGVFMAILDIQITNASLRDIFGTLSATQDEGSWMSTSYLAAEVTVIPLSALFMRVFGVRTYMLTNTILFLIFSTLCGFAWNLSSMIVFRMLQGLAGGALIPTAMTLLLTRLPPQKRATGLAWLMLSTTLAPAFGPTIGGVLTNLYGWPSIFFINWLPGVFMFLGLAYGLDREAKKLHLLWEADWLAIVMMVIGLASLIIFLEEGNREDWFESDFIKTFFVLAAFGMISWVTMLMMRDKPYINLRLFGRRNFGVSSLVGAASGMGLYGSTFLLPLFLAQIAGYNSLQIGEVIMWMGMPQIIMMPIAAKLAKRYDNRIICSAGLFLFSISCFLNSTMDASTSRDQLIMSQVFRALGQPFIILTLSNFATNRMELENLSSASSLFNMSRILGGAVGTAVLATVLTVREQFHSNIVGQSISQFSLATRERMDQLTQNFQASGVEPVMAAQKSLVVLDNLVRRESFVMAYNDSFFVLGSVLLASTVLIWMSDRVVAGGGK